MQIPPKYYNNGICNKRTRGIKNENKETNLLHIHDSHITLGIRSHIRNKLKRI